MESREERQQHLDALQRGLKGAIYMNGEKDVSVLQFYDDLSNIFFKDSNYDECMSSLEKAFEVRLHLMGNADESVVDTHYRIAHVLKQKLIDKFQNRTHHSSGQNSNQYESEEEHLRMYLFSNADLHRHTNENFTLRREFDALPKKKRIKFSRSSGKGTDFLTDIDSTLVYCDIADRLISKDNHKKAADFYERCIRLRKSKFGAEHPSLPEILSKYADSLSKNADASSTVKDCYQLYTKALECVDEAMTVYAKTSTGEKDDDINNNDDEDVVWSKLSDQANELHRAVKAVEQQLPSSAEEAVANDGFDSARYGGRGLTADRPRQPRRPVDLEVHTRQPQQLIAFSPPATPSGGVPMMEQFSEAEDVLSGEISLEQMYQKLVSADKKDSGLVNGTKIDDSEVAFLQMKYGVMDHQVESSLLKLVESVFDTAYRRLLKPWTGDSIASVHLLLDELNRISETYANPSLKAMVDFAVNRARSFAYSKEGNYPMAMKCIAPAISSCPKVDGYFVGGLSDALVQLTEAYSALGRRDDALHSARLAVNTAHERLDSYNKTKQIFGKNSSIGLDMQASKSDVPLEIGPNLDCYTSTILAYCTLAAELERSGLGHLSLEWYQRAEQAACKFCLDETIVKELRKSIELAKGFQPTAATLIAVDQPRVAKVTHTRDSYQRPFSSFKDLDDKKTANRQEKPKLDRLKTAPVDHHMWSGTGKVTRNESGSGKGSDDHEEIVQGPDPALMSTTESPLTSNSKARPRSAHPRLLKRHSADGSSSEMDIHNNNPLSGGGVEALDNAVFTGNYALERDGSNNKLIRNGTGGSGGASTSDITPRGEARVRPKSAVSKLGGGYSSPIAPLLGSNTLHVESNDIYDQMNVGTTQDKMTSAHQNRQQIEQSGRPMLYSELLSADASGPDTKNRGIPVNAREYIAPSVGEEAHLTEAPTKKNVESTSNPRQQHSKRSRPAHAIILITPSELKHQKDKAGINHAPAGVPENTRKDKKKKKQGSSGLIAPSQDIAAAHALQYLSSSERGIMKSASTPVFNADNDVNQKQKSVARKAKQLSSMKSKSKQVEIMRTRVAAGKMISDMMRNSGTDALDDEEELLGAGKSVALEHPNQTQDDVNFQDQQRTKGKPPFIPSGSTSNLHKMRDSLPPRSSSAKLHRNSSTISRSNGSQKDDPVSVPGSSAAAAENRQQKVVLTESAQEYLRRTGDMVFPYIKGMRVEARYLSSRLGTRAQFYPGRIVGANFAMGQYDVHFDNGEIEKGLFVDDIRVPQNISKRPPKPNPSHFLREPTSSNRRPSTADAATRAANVGRTQKLSCKQLRQRAIEDMHHNAVKVLTGIKHREEKRLQERNIVRQQKASQIGALMKGATVRMQMPFLQQQLLKEKELREKEKALQLREQKLLEQLENLQVEAEDNCGTYPTVRFDSTQPVQTDIDAEVNAETTNLMTNNGGSDWKDLEQRSSIDLDSSTDTANFSRKPVKRRDLNLLRDEIKTLHEEQQKLFQFELERHREMEQNYQALYRELLSGTREIRNESPEKFHEADVFDDLKNAKVEDGVEDPLSWEGANDSKLQTSISSTVHEDSGVMSPLSAAPFEFLKKLGTASSDVQKTNFSQGNIEKPGAYDPTVQESIGRERAASVRMATINVAQIMSSAMEKSKSIKLVDDVADEAARLVVQPIDCAVNSLGVQAPANDFHPSDETVDSEQDEPESGSSALTPLGRFESTIAADIAAPVAEAMEAAPPHSDHYVQDPSESPQRIERRQVAIRMLSEDSGDNLLDDASKVAVVPDTIRRKSSQKIAKDTIASLFNSLLSTTAQSIFHGRKDDENKLLVATNEQRENNEARTEIERSVLSDDESEQGRLLAESEAKTEEEARLIADAIVAEETRRTREAKAAEEARVAAEAKAAEEACVAAEAKAAEEARLAAEAKAAEEARLAAEAKAAEEARVAAEAKAAEEARVAAEAKAAEEARVAAEAKAAEEARVAAEAKAAEEARVAAEAKAAEEARLAAEAKAAEEARIATAAKAVEEARLAAEAKAAEGTRIAAEDIRLLKKAKEIEEARMKADADARKEARHAALEKSKEDARRVQEAIVLENEAKMARIRADVTRDMAVVNAAILVRMGSALVAVSGQSPDITFEAESFVPATVDRYMSSSTLPEENVVDSVLNMKEEDMDLYMSSAEGEDDPVNGVELSDTVPAEANAIVGDSEALLEPPPLDILNTPRNGEVDDNDLFEMSVTPQIGQNASGKISETNMFSPIDPAMPSAAGSSKVVRTPLLDRAESSNFLGEDLPGTPDLVPRYVKEDKAASREVLSPQLSEPRILLFNDNDNEQRSTKENEDVSVLQSPSASMANYSVDSQFNYDGMDPDTISNRAVDEKINELNEDIVPYALTLVLPKRNYVSIYSATAQESQEHDNEPTVVNADEAFAVDDNLQRRIYLLPDIFNKSLGGLRSSKDTKLCLDLYEKPDDNADALPDEIDTRNLQLMFHTEFNKDYLIELFRSMAWGDFEKESTSGKVHVLNSCAIRGSLLKADYLMKLVVRLWQSYISWTVQSILVHAAVVELVGEVVMEIQGLAVKKGGFHRVNRRFSAAYMNMEQIKTTRRNSLRAASNDFDNNKVGELTEKAIEDAVKAAAEAIDSTEPRTTSVGNMEASAALSDEIDDELLHGPWEQDFQDLLQTGRNLFLRFQHRTNEVVDDMGVELRHWEFDLRKILDGSMDGLEVQQLPEQKLSSNLQAIANIVHEKLCFYSLEYNCQHHNAQIGTERSADTQLTADSSGVLDKIVAATSSPPAVGLLTDAMVDGKKRPVGGGVPKTHLLDTWVDAYDYLVENLQNFLEAENIGRILTKDIEDYFQDSCKKVFINSLLNFKHQDWKFWWTCRDRCDDLIGQDAVDAILHQCEDIMYRNVFEDPAKPNGLQTTQSSFSEVDDVSSVVKLVAAAAQKVDREKFLVYRAQERRAAEAERERQQQQ